MACRGQGRWAWEEGFDRQEISVGVSCIPYRIEKFITKNGKLEKLEVVSGQKFPLLGLRQGFSQTTNLICAWTQMRKSMTWLYRSSVVITDIPATELRNNIKQVQLSRSLILWCDHSTILGLGSLLVTAHIAYHPAVFYTQSEYEEMHEVTFNPVTC